MKPKLKKAKRVFGQGIRARVEDKKLRPVTRMSESEFLTVSSPPGKGLNDEEQAAFSAWKRNIQARNTKIDYP